MGTRIKICGITNLEDALAAVSFGADSLGFIFASSPRQVTIEQAGKIIKKLPPFIASIAVVVNERKNNLNQIINSGLFNALQLHGEEKPELCRYLTRKIKIIKSFRVKDKESLKNIGRYKVEAILLDTFLSDKYGGTGVSFNWDLAKKVTKKNCPVILSGGLNPSNVAAAIKKVRPYAVDTSSGVEKYPGKKDIGLLKKFINEVKKTNRLFYN